MSWTRRTAISTTLLLVLVACGSGGGASSQPAGPEDLSESPAADTEGSTAPETSTNLEAELLEDYEAAKDALHAAFDPPDPDHPDLLAYWDGAALARVQDALRQLQSGGISWVGSIETDPAVVTLDDTTAVVRDCVRDSVRVIDTGSSEPVGPVTESLAHVESSLELHGETWMVVEEEELSEPCTPA